MQALTGAVLIAAAGIFWLIAIQSRNAEDISGIIAVVLGFIGTVTFVRGAIANIRNAARESSDPRI